MGTDATQMVLTMPTMQQELFYDCSMGERGVALDAPIDTVFNTCVPGHTTNLIPGSSHVSCRPW